MANATARVPMTTTPYEGTRRRWPLAGSLAVTYYPGCMIGLNSSGYAQKLDDSARLSFIGINAESTRIESESGDANGDKYMNVDRPLAFQMTIASAAITDVGKKVYAAYDNEVQYGDGTYGNYVGRVLAYIDSTTVLVAPPWSPLHEAQGFGSVFSANAASGTTLTRADANKVILVPNTAAVTITLPAVAGMSPGDTLTFIKTTADAYAFVLDGASSETIDDAATLTSGTQQWTTIKLVTDGAEWYSLGQVIGSSGDMVIADGFGLNIGSPSQQTISNGDGSTNLIPEVQVLGTGKADASMLLASFNTTDDTTVAPSLNFLKSGHATIGSNTVVASGEILGEVNFFGADGTDFESCAARIHAAVNATPGTGDMAGRIVFSTSSDGAEALVERMRIAEAGVTLGLAGTTLGKLLFSGNTAGTVTVQSAATAGDWTLTLPPDDGDAGEQLQTNGSGVTTWEAAGSLRAVKNVIAEVSDKAQQVLDRLLGVGVYEFTYKESGRPTTGDYETVYTGVMAEELPEVMHHGGRIFSPVSAFGELLLAIKALAGKVERLEAAACA